MYQKFEELLKLKGVKASDVAKATGIRQGVFTDWKKGRYTPKADKMRLIAQFFGVSTEYLMNGQEQHEQIDPDFIFLKESFSKLSQDDKNEIMALITIKLENQKKKKDTISA